MSWSMCCGAIRRNTNGARHDSRAAARLRREITSCFTKSREIRDSASAPGKPATSERGRYGIHTKLRNILAKVDQIMEKAKRIGRPVERVNSVRNEIEQLQKEMLEQF